jgi:hypothetical protein
VSNPAHRLSDVPAEIVSVSLLTKRKAPHNLVAHRRNEHLNMSEEA